MSWAKVKLVWLREIRDQMRDRRTIFTVAVLPILLYPLMGMVVLQVSQFKGEQQTRVLVIGQEELPAAPPLIVEVDGHWMFHDDDAHLIASDAAEDPEEAADEAIQEVVTEDEPAPPKLEIILADASKFAGLTEEEVRTIVKAGIDDGKYDAAVYFPPDFSERYQAYREFGNEGSAEQPEIPEPNVYVKTSKDRSRIARDQINRAIHKWGRTVYSQTLETNTGVKIESFKPIQSNDVEVAEQSSIRAHVWSKILPFVMMIWALTGAFYPAIDLCAGEKERGTLETLLTSPAQRGEIVWGKLLAVTTFSIATAILNLLSLVGTGSFVVQAIGNQGDIGAMALGPPPLAAVAWLLVALIPAAFMFSALALAVAAMARSSKEGQYYLMPLLLISLPLMVLPILPSTELTLGTSLVPITGLIFVLRKLIEAEYADALRYALPVIGVTMLCMWLSIRWAIDQFNKEEVLFRESEQFSLGIWLKHLVRDRKPTPTLTAALMFTAVLMVLRFFSMFGLNKLFPPPQSFTDFSITTIVTLVGLIAVPAVLAALFLTKSPKQTLLLKRAPAFSVLAAFVLALCVHPLLYLLSDLVGHVFPAGEEIKQFEKQFQDVIAQAPGMWAVLLLIAVLPAICEELAFRGYILSGLRHMGHKWGAILLSALFFGVAHGMLQQEVMAFLTGIVIGYIAVQTGSLWPCVIYHFTNNGTVLVVSSIDEAMLEKWPMLQWMFVNTGDGYEFAWWVTIVGASIGAAILWWFSRLPSQESAEEKLQKARDHQHVSVGAKKTA